MTASLSVEALLSQTSGLLMPCPRVCHVLPGEILVKAHKIGRVRLIDETTGAKLVLELRKAARSGPIVDIAATSTSVAIVGGDSSVTIFTVPESWNQDNADCSEIAYISPSPNVPITQVEWIQKGSGACLAIATPRGIITLDKSTAASRRNMSIDDLVSSLQMAVAQVSPSHCGLSLTT